MLFNIIIEICMITLIFFVLIQCDMYLYAIVFIYV